MKFTGKAYLILGGCAAVAAAAVIYGCSSSSSGGGATATNDAAADSPTMMMTGGDSGTCTDPPDCVHCADLTSAACRGRAAVCMCNKPSSAEIANAQATCACQTQCATECAATCGGQGDPSQACLQCQLTKCAAETAACFGDLDTFDPTCNPNVSGEGGAGEGGASDASDDGASTADAADAGGD
jgi:hypothetical protein